MSQQDAEPETLLSSSRIQKTEMESNGPPRTPYGIAAFVLTVVVTACSWLFKLWDGSEFPETFAHPAYWLLLGVILLLGGLWAFGAGKKRSLLDFGIVEVLFLAAAIVFVLSVSVYREARPSEKVFTVALFTFSDHTTTKDVGQSFRDNIQRELEAKYRNQIMVVARDREIKGEKPEERALMARVWGSRSEGCHLAVWAEIFMDKDGQNYVVNLHWLKVYPFGTQQNHDDVELFDEVNESFVARSAGKGAVDEDGINKVVNAIALSYGLASYDKTDYDTSLRILSSLGTLWSEFFAGHAAFQKALHSTQTLQLINEAEAHYLRANALDKDEAILWGNSYAGLGKTYQLRMTLGITDEPIREANKAIMAFSKGAEICKKRGYIKNYSYFLLRQASLLFEISELEESPRGSSKDLDEAESKIKEALNNIKPESEDYSDAQNLLGQIYEKRGEYTKAIGAHETALRLIPAEMQVDRLGTFRLLGNAQTNYAWRIHDRSLHEQGLGNLRRASEICEAIVVPFECSLAHMSAGTASFNWADRLQQGSPAWIAEIEKAITEFELSALFVSKKEQAQLYAQSKQRIALANTRRASTERGDERIRFLKAALSALTDGIDALSGAGFDTKQFYIDRAQCYDRLRLSSNDELSKNEYSRLARQDKDASTK
jgi:hypothetical protein